MSIVRNVIGGYFISLAFVSLFKVLFVLIVLLFSFISESWLLGAFYLVMFYTLLIASFIYGYYSTKKKNVMYDIFYPNTHKFIGSIIIALLFSVVLFSILHFVSTIPLEDFRFLFLYFLAAVLVCYPFSALIYYIYDKKRNKSTFKIPLWVLVLIVSLNPLFLDGSNTPELCSGLFLNSHNSIMV